MMKTLEAYLPKAIALNWNLPENELVDADAIIRWAKEPEGIVIRAVIGEFAYSASRSKLSHLEESIAGSFTARDSSKRAYEDQFGKIENLKVELARYDEGQLPADLIEHSANMGAYEDALAVLKDEYDKWEAICTPAAETAARLKSEIVEPIELPSITVQPLEL